jgi:hypothetical protein
MLMVVNSDGVSDGDGVLVAMVMMIMMVLMLR